MLPTVRPLLAFLCLFPLTLQAQVITTFAGTPTVFGNGNTSGPATSISIGHTWGVAVDNSGNVFFTDYDNSRLWKVNPAGIASVYAGTGTAGETGDGGPATSAQIEYPELISVDNAGNLYLVESYDEDVRKIDASGIITTFIPKTQIGPASTGDGGPLSAATFRDIHDVVPDNKGNIYISDDISNVVRKVNSAGIITTIAGTGVAGYSGDGGPATAAELHSPAGVSFDNAGNIYIGDVDNYRLRKIDAAGVITTVAGNGTVGYSGSGGPATNAQFWTVYKAVFDGSGNMFIDDQANNVAWKVDNTGIITVYAGSKTYGYSGDGGPAINAKMANVYDIAVDNAGNLYLADHDNFVIRKVSKCLIPQETQDPAGNTICAGDNAAFTMAVTGATSYLWQVNGGSGWLDIADGGVYSGAATNSLTITSATAGMNASQYRCTATNTCGTTTSNPATLTVNTPSAPTVTIATSNVVCAGGTADFSATVTNGGTTPIYQWQLNGTNTGANSPTYSNPAPANGDIVKCLLTGNSTCATTNSATSNALAITVNPPVTPAITIAGPTNAICANTPATFIVDPANGGTAPAFQWLVNGQPTTATGATYTTTTLNNGDVVSCVLTSNAICATTTTATSNAVTMTVNPLVTPAITVTGPPTAICTGQTASFTATPANGGANPAYQWLLDGLPTGATGPTYTAASPNNGDAVSCVLTSNAACATTNTITSDPVTITVDPYVTPAVSITGPPAAICAGQAASFTATPANGGANPAYQWLLNGLPTGATGPAYTTTTLNNGDAVSCTLTSDAACLATPNASSNTIVQRVTATVNASVSIVPSNTTICSGTQVTFTATPVNGGSEPTYQWQVNAANTGPNAPVFVADNLANGDVVNCILTSSLTCSTPAAAQNQIVMTVDPSPTVVMMPDTLIALGQSLPLLADITGPVTAYQWTPADGLDNAYAATPTATPDNTTTYQLTVETDAKCTAIGKVTVSVFKSLKMPGAFTPNGDGRNDLFRIPPSLAVKIKAFTVYNRWGARIFYTTNSSAGWDGTAGGQPQPTGTYVWVIDYDDLITGKPAEAKGTVILVR